MEERVEMGEICVAERVEIVKFITDIVKWRVEMTESFGREG